MIAEVCEGEHEACASPPEDRLDGSLHELEDVREVLGFVEFAREIHQLF
jgi:hypothetical protein